MTVPSPAVVPEPDATPLVRLLTRTIRTSLHQRPDLVGTFSDHGIVVIKSSADAQVASVEVDDEEIRVISGANPGANAVLTVDLTRRLEVVEFSAEGHHGLVAMISALIMPALPPWSDAAHEFWRTTGPDAGMPGTLVIQNAEQDGDVLELGAGLPRYIVSGTPDALAGLFTGADSFLAEVYAGNLKVRGTLPQLSVMAGASFKVRFHV
jgi:hypothetical protein